MFQSSPAVASRCNYTIIGPARGGPVSILTGCRQPVQRPALVLASNYLEFQSSPAVASRCNVSLRSTSLTRTCWFQSSPAVASRCNKRAGISAHMIGHLFQSSPAVASRCNNLPILNPTNPPLVSILTGCRQPVQRCIVVDDMDHHPVSILTGCRQPVQLVQGAERVMRENVSILTGCRQPVQQFLKLCAAFWAGFNPHRLSPAGAT